MSESLELGASVARLTQILRELSERATCEGEAGGVIRSDGDIGSLGPTGHQREYQRVPTAKKPKPWEVACEVT